MKKLGTAGRVLREEGPAGVLRTAWQRGRMTLYERVGARVEARGQRLRVHGVTVCVDAPGVPTYLKGEWQCHPSRYEGHEVALIRRHLPRELPVIELGGCLGGVSCVINRRLARPTEQLVLEANPGLLAALERTRAWNQASFTIVPGALAYDAPEVPFALAESAKESHLGEGAATVTVPAVTLARLAEQAGAERFALVCDIEGAELDLFAREGELLAARVEALIVELHPRLSGPAAIAAGLARLADLGFRPLARRGDVHAFRAGGGSS